MHLRRVYICQGFGDTRCVLGRAAELATRLHDAGRLPVELIGEQVGLITTFALEHHARGSVCEDSELWRRAGMPTGCSLPGWELQ